MTKRKLEELFIKILMIAATILVAGSFFLIVWTIFSKGIPYMNLDMITKIPGGGFYIGKEGGVLNAIIGSVYIAGGATVLGLLISVPVALYINLYISKLRLVSNALRLAFDVLFGIPSIVYGAFGFLLMVYFGIRASLLGGIIAVTLLVIPIMVRTLDEVLHTVPGELRDAALTYHCVWIQAGW